MMPANALQYAAFAGKADAIRFLLSEGRMGKSDEGSFGHSPSDIFCSHRLDTDGHIIEEWPQRVDMGAAPKKGTY